MEKDEHNPYNHIIFTGDLIHGDIWSDEDYSLEILDLVREYIEYPNFHILLGNHELSQIYEEDCYKYFINQTEEFKKMVEKKYPNNPHKYYEYQELMMRFETYCVTSNGVFIIHSGIHEDYIEPLITDSVDLNNILWDNKYEQKILTEHLWSRPYDDFTEKSIDKILEYYACKYMVTGHTNYNGCHIIGNQLIFDSSYCTDNKYYLEFNTHEEFKDIINLMQHLKIKNNMSEDKKGL